MKKIDFHVHINNRIPIDDTVKYFNDMCKRFGYCGVGIMSIIAGSSYGDDPGCNDRALKLKQLMPGSFAFAALDHKRDFISQTREYMLSGFDGIKILEGKPSVYRYNLWKSFSLVLKMNIRSHNIIIVFIFNT